MNNELCFIDLFAGAGGLSEGFIREGFKLVAFVEKDPDACLTLKTRLLYNHLRKKNKMDFYYNYLKGEISREDLYNLAKGEFLPLVIQKEINEDLLSEIFKEIDQVVNKNEIRVIIGGPPCQTYSTIGMSRINTESDKRSYLYRYYYEFLMHYNPDIFVFENVPGLISKANQNYFQEIITLCQKAGYVVEYKVLNAADYGVLQNRKRLFIIGYKKNIKFSFPEPCRINKGYTLKDIFTDLPDLNNGERKHIACYTKKANKYLIKSFIRNREPFTTLHITRSINDHDKKIYRIAINKLLSEGKKLSYLELPPYLQTHKNKTSFTDRFKVLDLNGFSHTLVAHLSKDGHYYIYPSLENPRSISVREAARIQSFPDDYFFEGSMTSNFKQIGNAVPILLAQAIANQIKKCLITGGLK